MRAHVTLRRVALEAELQAAEQRLDRALERRHQAEQVLWRGVRSRNGDAPSTQELDAARASYLDAEQQRTELERSLVTLRAELRTVREREARLVAVTGARLEGRNGQPDAGRGSAGGIRGWVAARLGRRH